MQTFRLDARHFFDPRWLGRLRGRQVAATVGPEGRVQVDGTELVFRDDPPPDGTAVVVWIATQGHLVAALAADVHRERVAALDAAAAEQAAERARRNQARLDAAAFNGRIQPPVAWDVAIKLARSGLSDASWGHGRYRSTVQHVLLRSPLRHGRLHRRAGDLLCSCSPTRSNGRMGAAVEIHHDGDGIAYAPAITCSTCLALLEKHGWLVSDPVTSGPDE